MFQRIYHEKFNFKPCYIYPDSRGSFNRIQLFCQQAEKNVTSANKDLDDANREYLADVENYRKEATDNIEVNDRRITELKATINDQSTDVRDEYKKQIDDLEQKNREMKKKISEYKANGKGGWEIFKSEFKHDMEALGQAFKDITVRNIR